MKLRSLSWMALGLSLAGCNESDPPGGVFLGTWKVTAPFELSVPSSPDSPRLCSVGMKLERHSDEDVSLSGSCRTEGGTYLEVTAEMRWFHGAQFSAFADPQHLGWWAARLDTTDDRTAAPPGGDARWYMSGDKRTHDVEGQGTIIDGELNLVLSGDFEANGASEPVHGEMSFSGKRHLDIE